MGGLENAPTLRFNIAIRVVGMAADMVVADTAGIAVGTAVGTAVPRNRKSASGMKERKQVFSKPSLLATLHLIYPIPDS